MNYRHAFHAGNFADIHKHWILMLLLERLAAKDKPFFVLDSHAGAGFYDLIREETERTGEAVDGILRLLEAKDALPDTLARYVDTIRALNAAGGLRWYPGSPWLIAQALRPGDRLTAIEAHPDEYRLLRETLAEFRSSAKAFQRDGYAAIPSLLPPPERRGLTLIDPPFETGEDVERITKAVTDGIRRFPTGSFAIWYPIKTHALGNQLCAALPDAGRGRLRCELWVAAPDREDAGLRGSGMILLNPIWPLEDSLRAGMPALCDILAQGEGAGWRLEAF